MSEGIPFLGFVTFPQQRLLKQRKRIQFRRRLRAAVEAFEAGNLPATRLAASVQGWMAHARYGNTAGLRQAVLGDVPTAIRAMIGPSTPK